MYVYTCIHSISRIQLDKVGIQNVNVGSCNSEEQYKPACLVWFLLGHLDSSYCTNYGPSPLRVWAESSDPGVGTMWSTVLPTSACQSLMNSLPTQGDPLPGLYWEAFKKSPWNYTTPVAHGLHISILMILKTCPEMCSGACECCGYEPFRSSLTGALERQRSLS